LPKVLRNTLLFCAQGQRAPRTGLHAAASLAIVGQEENDESAAQDTLINAVTHMND